MGFSATLSRNGRIALITLEGELDALHADDFRNRVEQAANGGQIDQLVLDMTDLTYMSSARMRGLVFARQKMGEDIRIVRVRASDCGDLADLGSSWHATRRTRSCTSTVVAATAQRSSSTADRPPDRLLRAAPLLLTGRRQCA